MESGLERSLMKDSDRILKTLMEGEKWVKSETKINRTVEVENACKNNRKNCHSNEIESRSRYR